MGFPSDLAGKESACNVGGLGSTPGLGRSPGEGKGYPIQYSGLENSMDYIVHGVTKSRTWLGNFHLYQVPDATLQPPTDIPSLRSTRAGSQCRRFRTPHSGGSLLAPRPVDSMTGRVTSPRRSPSETAPPSAGVFLPFTSSPSQGWSTIYNAGGWSSLCHFCKIERKEMEETRSRLKPQCRRDPCPFHLLSLARANHAPKSDIYRTGKHRHSPEKESNPRYHPPHLPMRQYLRKAPKKSPKKKKN